MASLFFSWVFKRLEKEKKERNQQKAWFEGTPLAAPPPSPPLNSVFDDLSPLCPSLKPCDLPDRPTPPGDN